VARFFHPSSFGTGSRKEITEEKMHYQNHSNQQAEWLYATTHDGNTHTDKAYAPGHTEKQRQTIKPNATANSSEQHVLQTGFSTAQSITLPP